MTRGGREGRACAPRARAAAWLGPLARSVLALALLALPVRALGADAEPLRVELVGGAQLDRLHSVVADSVGLSNSHAAFGALTYDFRVLRIPMAGDEKPALHVVGDVLLGRRVLPVGEFAGGAFTGTPVQRLPVVELSTGILWTVPMSLVDKGAGSELVLGYRGGLLLTSGGRNDFPHVKQAVIGFARTRGLFERSAVTLAYGTNEAAGRRYGARRWDAHVLLMARLGGLAGSAPPHAPPAKGAAPVPPSPSALHLFVEFDVDTDGSVGPDLLMTRAGLRLDAGRVLAAVLGAD